MKTSEWLDSIFAIYSPVTVLSDRNGKKALRLKHKKLGREIVLITFEDENPVYDFLKTVRHENLADVLDVLKFEDGEAVLEEYLPGMTVAQVLETGLYDYHGAKTVMIAICRALDALHKHGFVYRDLKPENVLITDEGEIKLIDFDSCRVSTTEKSYDTVALGTPGYASPEQYGIKQSDARSDIYSAGVFLNVMLTGTHPSEKLAKGRVGRIVLKCTQISPEKRPPSVLDLMNAL
ncbi:MAG: serine/threonine protein kinase [Clostridia bacterium]|nr:serine/threonine protein kinase [Clostridia bacterium]